MKINKKKLNYSTPSTEEKKEIEMEVSKNIYQKLALARVLLQETALKKSGSNAFAKYEYFELGDFLPAISKINLELGLLTKFSFGKEECRLTIINSDADKNDPDRTLDFTSPTVMATMKGSTPIQELGATQTYCRRYLFIMAYEISECDVVETRDPHEPQRETKQEKQEQSKKGAENQSNIDVEFLEFWGTMSDAQKKACSEKFVNKFNKPQNNPNYFTSQQKSEIRKLVEKARTKQKTQDTQVDSQPTKEWYIEQINNIFEDFEELEEQLRGYELLNLQEASIEQLEKILAHFKNKQGNS